MPYIPHTQEELQQMLDYVGVPSLDALFADIPQDMRPKSFDFASGKEEMEVCRIFEDMAQSNTALPHFLGAGFYDHYIPKAVETLCSRGEFVTAYTPYQPEASQGTLQSIFEYQTAVCRLLGMEVSNASMYDGGTALFESCMMSVRATKRHKIVLDEAVNPFYRKEMATHLAHQPIEIVLVPHKNGRSDKDALIAAMDNDCAAVIVQNPNFFGALDDYTELMDKAHEVKALGIISVYPLMQSLLKTPGEMGADVCVADGQSLGQPLSFGGPYLGIMTCKKAHVRQLPGRIIGRTVDLDGKVGYVLTLQAREQHIRRAKATSNICSNQSLCALRAIVYMSLMGTEGLSRAAEISVENAHELAEKLCAVKGVSLLNDAPFANEFALRVPKKAADIIDDVMAKGIIPGFAVSKFYEGMDDVLLIACTEKTTKTQMAQLVSLLEGVL